MRGLDVLLGSTQTGLVQAFPIGDAGFIGGNVLIFRRGQCVALLELEGATYQTFNLLEQYGRRLDERLRTLGC